MAYPCDLPANMGNTDIFRAIYNKIGNSDISTGKIEEKLNVISGLLTVVNNNIEANTLAIKDASLNVNVDVKVDTGNICDSIDKVNESINSGFNRTIRTIKETRSHPKPVPPCPPLKPHPCPCPPIPEPIYDCYHHYLPNDSYFHNLCIQSNHNLTIEQKAYLEEVYRCEHKFDSKEYYLLPHYVPCVGLVNDVYNDMIYDL